jgi:hypothetical protein
LLGHFFRRPSAKAGKDETGRLCRPRAGFILNQIARLAAGRSRSPNEAVSCIHPSTWS